MSLADITESIIAGLLVSIIVSAAKALHYYMKERRLPPLREISLLLVIFFVIFSTIFFVIFSFFIPLSQNELWTRTAWGAYERGDYYGAMESAQRVVDEYARKAEDIQAELEKEGEPMPPLGKVSRSDAKRIFSRGLLNDVAACYWILGQSYERTNQGCEAKSVYTKASRLTYARVWDPQWWPFRGWSPLGFFWSPAECASYRIAKVSCPQSSENES